MFYHKIKRHFESKLCALASEKDAPLAGKEKRKTSEIGKLLFLRAIKPLLPKAGGEKEEARHVLDWHNLSLSNLSNCTTLKF